MISSISSYQGSFRNIFGKFIQEIIRDSSINSYGISCNDFSRDSLKNLNLGLFPLKNIIEFLHIYVRNSLTCFSRIMSSARVFSFFFQHVNLSKVLSLNLKSPSEYHKKNPTQNVLFEIAGPVSTLEHAMKTSFLFDSIRL